MDKLEHYLDQVCRGIAGPKALRLHIRQELREHLLDAAAEHRTSGLSEEEALARALVDFGGPEQVRLELEALHGHRLMAVVIDKAMQWKESTMKAKWLWASWAYLTLVGVIALEVMLLTFTVIFIIPKFQKLMQDGIIDRAIIAKHEVSWMPAFLEDLKEVGGHYTTPMLLLTAAVWGLFEWLVRSENKSMMRLSALGTAALGLMGVVGLTAGSLVISFCLGVPATGRLARPFALDQIANIDVSIRKLEEAMAKKDWAAMQDHANQAHQTMDNLATIRLAISSLALGREPMAVDELRAQVKAANEYLQEALQAIREKNPEQLDAAMRKFHNKYEQVQAAAKKPAK